MKMLVSLLAVLALVSPAIAQKIVIQGTHPRPKVAIVAPAAKPVVLHTGKPITQDQKRQLLASAIQAYTAKLPAGQKKPQAAAQPATPATITVDQLNQEGVFFAYGISPQIVNPTEGLLIFNGNSSSSLIFMISARQNVAYILTVKVYANALPGHVNAQFIINNAISAQNAETVTAGPGENEIAYAFVSNSTGDIPVGIYSSNDEWNFVSAELTSGSF
jgi:hypothetical protein